jgi:hypothetical protein
MPTSAATNPALTIAANALRVSEAIHRLLANVSESDTVAAGAFHEQTSCAGPV